VLHAEAGGGLDTGVPAAGEQSFAGDPFGAGDPSATGAATFVTKPFERDVVLAGMPDLDLSASVTVPRVHLIATVYDQDHAGRRRRLTQFAINPELRHGVANPQPVVPAVRMTLDPPGFPVAHHVRTGHRLALTVTTSDPDKVPMFAVDPHVTVYTGAGGTSLRLPVVSAPDLRADDLRGVDPTED
jgi:predicted acyl esterase